MLYFYLWFKKGQKAAIEKNISEVSLDPYLG